MELVTFKMEKPFLAEVDEIARKSHYQNRTEFIRNALRDKICEEKLKLLMGSSKELSEKERAAKIRELKGKGASYILRKYGLD
jgi:Arc/MetJ-type ribon-helix-helix transcriptional regulator